MFTKRDRKKLECSQQYIEHLRRSYYSDNEYLKKKCDELLERSTKAESENVGLRVKVDLYEKYIAKMLESSSYKSDDVFMVDGQLYRITDYTITSNAGEIKTLSAEFDCMTGITKNFKEY